MEAEISIYIVLIPKQGLFHRECNSEILRLTVRFNLIKHSIFLENVQGYNVFYKFCLS